MAPELRQDFANLIPQSDYYSIGALLYEILTGRPPASPVKLPSELSPIFSVEADEVVLKSLSPNPADRFGSNIGFFGALNALRDALRQKRPTSFATSLGESLADSNEYADRNPEGTLSGAPEGHAAAVHAPNLVADPEQDFEPHEPSAQGMAMHDLEQPVHESEAHSAISHVPNPFAARESAPAENASAIMPAPNLDASAEKTMAVASPWAALEARMTDEVVVGENVAGSEPVARQQGEVKAFDEAWLAAPPTPTWVWVLIVLLALVLTAVAGYLGYHLGH
jgi:serine/threonine protein kinase